MRKCLAHRMFQFGCYGRCSNLQLFLEQDKVGTTTEEPALHVPSLGGADVILDVVGAL